MAGALVFSAAGYARDAIEHDPRIARRARAFIAVFVVAILVPLGLASLRTARYEGWVSSTTTIAEDWVDGTEWTLDSVKVAGDNIVISVLGTGASPPLDELKAEVRNEVPAHVPVVLVEESGSTTDL